MFENIKNFADLKKAYHKAARENHPDMGGDLETMKHINNDFDRAAARIEREGEKFGTEKAATENGKTYTHREAIKAAGCKWSKNKQAWYWHKGEYTRRGRRRYDMDEIRAMHGSETIRGSAPHRLTV